MQDCNTTIQNYTNPPKRKTLTAAEAMPINMLEAFGGDPRYAVKPTLEQYGLADVDLEQLQKDHEDYKARQFQKQSRQELLEIGKGLLTVSCFTGPPLLIAGIVGLFVSGINIEKDFLFFLLWGAAASGYLYYDYKSSDKKIPEEPFFRQEEWDVYRQYLYDCHRHEEYIRKHGNGSKQNRL